MDVAVWDRITPVAIADAAPRAPSLPLPPVFAALPLDFSDEPVVWTDNRPASPACPACPACPASVMLAAPAPDAVNCHEYVPKHDTTAHRPVHTVRFDVPTVTEVLLDLLQDSAALFSARNIPAAAVRLKKALRYGDEVPPAQRAHVHFMLGHFARHEGDFAAALVHFEACLALARHLHNPAEICLALCDVGDAHLAAATLRATDFDATTGIAQSAADAARHAIVNYEGGRVLARSLGRGVEAAGPAGVGVLVRLHLGLSEAHDLLNDGDTALVHAEMAVAAVPPGGLVGAAGYHQRALSRLGAVLKRWAPNSKANFDRRVELRWQQANVATALCDNIQLALIYAEIADEFENAGSFAAFYGPPKAAAFYKKALFHFSQAELSQMGPSCVESAARCARQLSALETASNADACSVS